MINFVDLKKRGGPHLFASHLAHGIPPPDRKSPRAHGQRLGGASPPPAKLARDSSEGLSGTEATCPRLVSHQEGLRFFEEGSREEPGWTLGRIVRDHGGSFPSTLTNLNRASRKKRSALDQTFCAPRRVLGLATGRQPINGCTREANSALL